MSSSSHLPFPRISLTVKCSRSDDGKAVEGKRTVLHDLFEQQGQSPCYDSISRPPTNLVPQLITSGIRGVTTNPAIFEKAMLSSNLYDEQLRELVQEGKDIESAYWEMVIKDIKDDCKLFKPLHDQTGGMDGHVSIEVSPTVAYDTQQTIDAAKFLHQATNSPNLLIKISATAESIRSVKEVISQGINVNVTVILCLKQYEAAIDAYLEGLEASGLADLSGITCVAAFYISRVDSYIDQKLDKTLSIKAKNLRGKAAVVQAKLAYKLFKKKFSSPRWEALEKKGANRQRLMWASTNTKNPTYKDNLYIDSLIGQDTLSTMPDKALEAFMDHGVVSRTIDTNLEEAEKVYKEIEKLGINWAEVGEELQHQALDNFTNCYLNVITTLHEKAMSFALSN